VSLDASFSRAPRLHTSDAHTKPPPGTAGAADGGIYFLEAHEGQVAWKAFAKAPVLAVGAYMRAQEIKMRQLRRSVGRPDRPRDSRQPWSAHRQSGLADGPRAGDDDRAG